MKQFIKKLNNFRLTTFIMAGIAVLGIIVTLLFFVAYQTTTAGSDIMFAQRDTTLIHNAFPDRPILGFVFFMAAFLAIILGVAVVAFCLPYIMPKEKGVPSKNIGWVLVAQQVFLLVLVALAVVNLITAKRETSYLVAVEEIIDGKPETVLYVRKAVMDTVLNKPFWIIDIALGVITIACGGFMAYPNAVCDFYCPEILTEAEEKARKEAKKAEKAARKAAKEAA